MAAAGRTALVVAVALACLAAGYGASRLLSGPDRSDLTPAIDLDRLPPAEGEPSTSVPGGATVVPPPTLPPGSTVPATPAPTAPPTQPPPTESPGDDDDDDPDDPVD